MLFQIFKLCLPVIFSYIPLGFAFGILAASNDLSLLQTAAISFFVYSGSAEFLLVGFISLNESLLGIFVILFLLSFRHFFYTLTLLNELRSLNFLRYYVIFALSDESFALLSTQKGYFARLNKAQKSLASALLCLFNQASWVLGSTLGYLFQKGSKLDFSGVEFSLSALFIVLAYDAYKQNSDLKLLLFALALGVLGLLLAPKSYMLFASLAAAFVFLMLRQKYAR